MPADLVPGKLAGGMSSEEIMPEYGLVRQDSFAALDYAAKHLGSEEITGNLVIVEPGRLRTRGPGAIP